MIAWLWALGVAMGGSLDLVEVGGPWGTVTGDDPTAIWWNPAGVAAGEGTRLLLEGAPVFASVAFDRAGQGRQDYKLTGVVPFLGVSTDARVPGLGLGAALYVPIARGAVAVDPEGPGRTHLREGNIQALHAAIAVGYRYRDLVAVGASVAYVHGSYTAVLDTEIATALADELVAANGGAATDYYPDDAVIEDPRYNATITLRGLSAHDVTFGAGVQVRPHPMLRLGLAWQHGWRADHVGDLALAFSCPPTSDELGRFGAEDRGLCFTQATGRGTVGYRYPGRVHAGVEVRPVERLRLELLGGVVLWSVFRDFEIGTTDVSSADGSLTPEAAALLSKERRWARDNRTSFYLALDGKVDVGTRVLLGARVGFDRAAVPDAVLSPNNYDADSLNLGALIAVRATSTLQIGASFTEGVSLPRTTAASAFDVAIDPAARVEDRYFYPGMAGTYRSAVHRVGVSIRGHFPWRARSDGSP